VLTAPLILMRSRQVGRERAGSCGLVSVNDRRVLAEHHDEWIEGRRYLGLDALARRHMSLVPDTHAEEVTQPLTAPRSAPNLHPPDPPVTAAPHTMPVNLTSAGKRLPTVATFGDSAVKDLSST